MKRLLRKHVQRFALFTLILLTFLLGSVSTYGFIGMDGQVVMAQTLEQDHANDILQEAEQEGPVVDTEEPKEGEAGRIQEGNADPIVDGKKTDTPPSENNTEPVDSASSTPEKANGDKPAEGIDPAYKEAAGKDVSPSEMVNPLVLPTPPINEEDLFTDFSEEVVPEAVRGGNSAFTVTKRPVDDPTAAEALVGEYDTFSNAMENCKQEDTSNLYIITVNQNYIITEDEGRWAKSSVNILLHSAEGGPFSIGTQSKWDFFSLSHDCNMRIENLTLDGSQNSQFVFISENGTLTLGAGVTLQNFVDVQDQDGPAIYMTGQSSLTIEPDVLIQNNQSNTTGGVICGNTENTIINIKGGHFINNSSTQQGRDGGFGGVIATFGTLNITGGSFEGNSATIKGGAIWLSNNSQSQIENASFLNNQAARGGAISASCPLVMSDCTLTQNRAKWGAGVFAEKPVTLSTINAAENQVNEAGGVLYLYAGGTIENSNFSHNSAEKQGGAIYLKAGDLTLSESTFTGNTATYGGGALFINHDGEGNSRVSSCEFTTNASSYFGGGIYLGRNQYLEVSASTFSKNEAAHGGGIATYGGPCDPAKTNLSIQSSIFAENVVLSGGGVFTAFPTQINQTTFSRNESKVHPQDEQKNPHVSGTGGALYVMDQQTDILGSNFTENTAYFSGGAICISGEKKDDQGNVTGVKPDIMVNISKGTHFEANNVKVGQGGAIYCAPYEYTNEITKDDAYTKLNMDHSTHFLNNFSGEGLFNPPSNYTRFTNLGYSPDSDVTHGILTRKSVLNNYDVNFKNDVCLITYIANGGTFDDGSEQQVEEHKLNENIIIKNAPRREGYRFIAWQTNQAKYQPGHSYSVNGNVTFVAQWEIINSPTPQPDDHGGIEGLSLGPVPAPSQNSVALAPVPAAPTPTKIYILPATGSASPAVGIFMGLGLVLVGLMLKKRS
ncbi:MAG: InlB B-repeat-containing protein [Clostridiales bacterium]|nr:InlB B-repeat-containing protein [Clostridiales bacterium]